MAAVTGPLQSEVRGLADVVGAERRIFFSLNSEGVKGMASPDPSKAKRLMLTPSVIDPVMSRSPPTSELEL